MMMIPSTVEQFLKQATKARREGRLPEARREAEEAVELSRRAGLKRGLVRALMLLGQIERDGKQGAAALKYYEEAVTISREADKPLSFAHTLRHLADLYCEEGRLELSRQCYQEVLAIYRAEREVSQGDLANALRGCAIMKDALGAVDEAQLLWEEARTLYASLGLKEGVAECENHLQR